MLALELHANLAVFTTFPAMHPIILKGRQAFSDFRLAALKTALNEAIDAHNIAEIEAVECYFIEAVSYTHLTLPTICSV